MPIESNNRFKNNACIFNVLRFTSPILMWDRLGGKNLILYGQFVKPWLWRKSLCSVISKAQIQILAFLSVQYRRIALFIDFYKPGVFICKGWIMTL